MAAINWSVIIPSGRPDRVAETVRSLSTQNLSPEDYEIVVVTPDAAALPPETAAAVRIVSTGRLFPPGKMRNLGAGEARGRLLCFLDDDCLAPSNFLKGMEQILRTRINVGAVGCRVIASDATFWNRCADQALFTAYQVEKEGETVGLGSAALAVRREAFEAVGGFDEQLLASEDWDFSLKLRAGGWLCWFTPDIEVLHDHRRGNFLAILQSAWKYGKASGLTVQKRHRETVSWIVKVMIRSEKYRIYWLLMLPYSCLLTLVWLLEVRPVKLLPCLPVIFLARLSYQFGVFNTLQKEV